MSQTEKLIQKLKSNPKDMTFEEAETLLGAFSYRLCTKGKTSGSRVKFISDIRAPIIIHKLHPRKELLQYQVAQLRDILEQEGLI